MTNFEAHKEEIEKFLLKNGHLIFGVAGNDEAVRGCGPLNCEECLLFSKIMDCTNARKVWLNAEAESEEMKLAKSLKLGDIVECWDDDEKNDMLIRYYNGLSGVDEYPFKVVSLRRNIGDKYSCQAIFKHIRLPESFESEEKTE